MIQKEKWAPVCPAPPEKNITSIIHPSMGKPTKVWRYFGANKGIWCFVCRFDFPDRKKSFLPLTFGNLNGVMDWHWRGSSSPRPLYRLLELMANPDAPVAFVEGEKAADRAAELFPDFVVTTTLGGSTSSGSADLEPLKNRSVVIWPDNDQAGQNYQTSLASFLCGAGVTSLSIVEVPKDFPEKWDLADELPDNYTLSDIRHLLKSAKPVDLVDEKTEFRTTCLATVKPEAIQWLWQPYIARGCLTMLDGDPGLGKSHITLWIAASISRGRTLPNQEDAITGTTLLVSCEDSLSHTVKPRLDRMDADSSRIHAYEEIFSLDEVNLSKLRLTIDRLRPDLLVIDPIFAYLGGSVDTNSANKVREILAPLSKIAAEFNCAMLCVRHLNKGGSGGSLIQRGMGSMDFIAAARSGLTVVKDPNDDQHRVMIHSKCNIAEIGPTWGFTFTDDEFLWTGESSVTEGDLRNENSKSSTAPSRLGEAVSFLESFLRDTGRFYTDILDLSNKNGFTIGTLNRAKKQLCIVSKKMPGKDGRWMWSLPTKPEDSQAPNPEKDEHHAHHQHVPSAKDGDQLDQGFDSFLEHLQGVQDGDHFGASSSESHPFQNGWGDKS